MNRLRIRFEDDRASFLPGEEIAGVAEWTLLEPPTSVEIHLFYYTVGKGDEDVEIRQSVSLPVTQEGESEFHLTMPQEPYSFSGKLISIIWAVELVAEPGAVTERMEIVVGPGKREIRVDAGEG